jgi:hypothetical protein
VSGLRILASHRYGCGFYGEFSRGGLDADGCWETAFLKVAEETKADPAEIRDFLDSRYGAGFARMVIELLPHETGNVGRAIDEVIGWHQQWRANWKYERTISDGLYCLIAWVLLTEAEAADP